VSRAHYVLGPHPLSPVHTNNHLGLGVVGAKPLDKGRRTTEPVHDWARKYVYKPELGWCVDNGDLFDIVELSLAAVDQETVEVLIGANGTIDGRVHECELVQSQPKAASLVVQLSADVTQLIGFALGVLRGMRIAESNEAESDEAVRTACRVRSEAVLLNHGFIMPVCTLTTVSRVESFTSLSEYS
jgi:hypothetical protein